jgi:hypothetical protein
MANARLAASYTTKPGDARMRALADQHLKSNCQRFRECRKTREEG